MFAFIKKFCTAVTLTVLLTVSIFAADSVVIQTFTFEDIIKRRGTFQFPDASEQFNKVIARYRLKCDPLTTQDRFNCGEWDYLTYTRIFTPTGEFKYSDRKHPMTTFGSFLLPEEGKTLTLTTTVVKDKFEKNNFLATATPNGSVNNHSLNFGNELPNPGGMHRSNYQFLVRASDLSLLGLQNGSNIGKIIFDGDIWETAHNLIIRVARTSSSSLNNYFNGTWDTVAIQSLLTSDDVIDGKITIDLFKNLTWNGTSNLIFELIFDDQGYISAALNGGREGQGVFLTPLSTAILADENSWIDIAPMPTISGGQNFTFEGWINISRSDSTVLDGAVIFSLGDKIIVRLVGRDDNGFQIQTEITDETWHNSRTTNRVLRYDNWTHIAIAFDGTQRGARERLRTVVNGNNAAMDWAFWGHEAWAGSVAEFVCETSATLAIGRGIYHGINSATNNLKAKIADVRIWDATLSTSEIADWRNKKIDNTHPNYANLLINYLFEDAYNSHFVTNSVSNFFHGKTIGKTYFSRQNFGLQYVEKTDFIPNITLVSGDFTYEFSNEKYFVEREQIPISTVFYNTELSEPTVENIWYHYIPTVTTFDVEGNIISEEPAEVNSFTAEVGIGLYDYQQKSCSQIYREFEIGRYITPYGINLDLGPNGFEWEYDMTDYMHLLRGEIILGAHNWQELIDLKFVFYRGAPSREILRVSEPWGPKATYLYRDLANDVVLQATTVDLLPETKYVKLKTRISGHGMVWHGTPGAAGSRQCCEFFDNEHRILAGDNLTEAAKWKIWQNCENNPVFPQGGTWMIHREGWCPGDVVPDFEFDLTPFVSDGKLTIDYDISRALLDGWPNTGGGDYRMAFHLIEYSEANFENDLELVKIITPSDIDIYRRLNPICNGITFIVRNNGTVDISKFSLNMINNAKQIIKEINLSKPLRPFVFDTVTVYIEDPEFWAATSTTNPEILISVINIFLPGPIDDDHTNNTIRQSFNLPDIYDKDNFQIRYRSNLRPADYELKIYNFDGDVVKTFKATAQNTTYNISLDDLPHGCYTLVLEDTRHNYGLSFWAVPNQGNGSFELFNLSGTRLKNFNPDFGKHITYSFVLNSFTSVRENENILASIYPNPSSDILNILSYENILDAVIDIFDNSGKIVYTVKQDISEGEIIILNISHLLVGSYTVRIKKGERVIWNRFIKQ